MITTNRRFACYFKKKRRYDSEWERSRRGPALVVDGTETE
jgi:hypothetical protein